MQTAQQLEGVRRRLAELIKHAHGEVSTKTVRAVAQKARVSYTTVARFILEKGDKRTNALRASTITSLAIALDAEAGWLRDGQGQRQLSCWPLLLRDFAESEIPDPHEEVISLLQQLQGLREISDAVRLRAYRAAVSAIIEVVTAEGQSIGHDAYRSLMRLDALRRGSRKLAVG